MANNVQVHWFHSRARHWILVDVQLGRSLGPALGLARLARGLARMAPNRAHLANGWAAEVFLTP